MFSRALASQGPAQQRIGSPGLLVDRAASSFNLLIYNKTVILIQNKRMRSPLGTIPSQVLPSSFPRPSGMSAPEVNSQAASQRTSERSSNFGETGLHKLTSHFPPPICRSGVGLGVWYSVCCSHHPSGRDTLLPTYLCSHGPGCLAHLHYDVLIRTCSLIDLNTTNF